MRNSDACAIVGYGFRLPGGIRTADQFWQLMSRRGFIQDSIADRYGPGYEPSVGAPGPDRFGSSYEGLLPEDAFHLFDSRLFGVSVPEATSLDPQARMLLTCTWEAFEQAGWDHARLRNSRTGVYIGAQLSSGAHWRPVFGPSEYSVTGNSSDMLASRISYTFNLMGPSTTYMTACSSGMTALHAAVTALASGDCDQAVVGAANHLSSALGSTGFARLGVISPDGACRSFDAAANGYMRAEGVFVYLVKPLAAAQRDGDRILAVVAGTPVNTAGAADGAQGLAPGRMITAPTRHAQVALMRTACARAGVSPSEVDYVEAHATGTRVGDRTEGSAIREVFGGPSRSVPLRIASVKSNVGHMEAAAFTCALLKTLLMFEYRAYAPISSHFAVPNPDIDFTGMRVQTQSETFGDRPVLVGINSFGFGGVNGHAVLAEYRPDREPVYSRPVAPEAGYLFPLSARTPEALRDIALSYRDLLTGTPPFDLYTLAANLSRRRTHFAVRTAFAATSAADLATRLDGFAHDNAQVAEVEESRGRHRILMVFAGQGTQWAGCGRELYATSPIFARTVDAVDAVWRQEAGYSLREACFAEAQADLDETRLAQPAIFMIEAALVDLLASWGVRADAVLGHSAGEVAAAYAAGILTLPDATRLVFHRSTLQHRTAGSGRMLAIDLDLAGTEALLAELPDASLEVACENSPVSTVVCGTEAALAPLTEALQARSITHRRLRGNVAFHSRAMDSIEQPLREGLAFLADRLRPASTPFISSVTGQPTEQLDAAYWWSNVRMPVRFQAAVRTAAANLRPTVVIEVSPHSVLLPAVQQCLAEAAGPARVATLHRNADSRMAFHEALGALFCQGVALDFAAQYPNPRPISHLLPPHPRNDVRMLDPMVDDMHFVKRGPHSAGPLIGRAVPGEHPRFEVRVSTKDYSWLTDHRVQNTPIMPAAGYVEMVLEALGGAPAYFDHVEFRKPCPIADVPVRLQTELIPEPGEPDQYSFRILSLGYDEHAESMLHCTGRVRRRVTAEPAPGGLATLDRSGFVEDRLNTREAFYGHLNAVLGEYFQYGPNFQAVSRVQRNLATQELLLDLRLDDALWRDCQRAGYLFAPPLLDGGLQAFLYFLMQCADISGVPRRMHALTIDRLPSSGHLLCHFTPPGRESSHELGQLRLAWGGEQVSGSLSIYDAGTGERVAHLTQYTSFHANPNADAPERSKYVISWQPKFVTDAPGLLGHLPADRLNLSTMVAALGSGTPPNPVRTLRVAEFSQTLAPGETAAAEYLRRPPGDEQVEVWLLASTAEHTRALFDEFKQGPAVRFATADLDDPDSIDLDHGLLRASACELVILDARTTKVTDAVWAFLRRLLLPGGVAAIRHPHPELAPLEPGWTAIGQGEQIAVWSAPDKALDDGPGEAVGPRWLIGDDGVALDSLTAQWLYSDATQEWLRSLRAIDLFCADHDASDPSGTQLTAQFLLLVQALSDARAQLPSAQCRLTVITRRSVLDVRSPRGATLWGAIRTLGLELDSQLAVNLRLVDLGDDADLPVLDWLARHDVRERELAIRSGRLYAPRLARRPGGRATVPASIGHPYRLMLTNPGQLNGLSMRTQPAVAPGPHQVAIDVAAVALNFRDVMVTMDMLPLVSYERSALGREVGMEGSGTVVATGDAVDGLRAGQRVMFLKGGCIGDHVVVEADAVFGVPDALTMEQAAGVLSVYLTAYHALIDLARLRAGQRVLVHSAMGGVGQAAIALARHAGATVYATAGTPDRRARLLDLGVTAAFDSHSYRWYDELLAATGGEGVDVVLNSLAGHHIALCLQALRPGGWHCEIGKVDIYADNTLSLAVFRKNLRFAAIDVDRLMNDDPAHARALTQACLRLIEDGTVPPLPVKTFGYADYEDALRFMANGQHEGKLVLSAPTDAQAAGLHVIDQRPFLDPKATYLVTGGMGGLGLCLVAYLVSAGARHLTLLDRDPGRGRDAQWVREASGIAHFFPHEDVQIDTVPADVSRRADVDRCLAGLTRPLKGVFHLAGVLDNQKLADVSPESVSAVFAPKADGAWHLHEATRDAALDHFVLLSSISSVFGNPGQSIYAAANGFLDALAAHRRELGLPALAYNLAAVTEVGMAARDTRVLRLARAVGLPPVSVALAITNLDFALRNRTTDAHLICAELANQPGGTENSDYLRTGYWLANDVGLTEGGGSGISVEDIAQEIANKITIMSGHDRIGTREPIRSFGLNSVSVTELAVFIATRFRYQVGVLELMTTSTSESVAEAILRPDTRTTAPQPGVSRGERRGRLPAPCQDDLDRLQQTIVTAVKTHGVTDTTTPDRFRAVLLTGATGFVGRFVLDELLRQNPQLTVHCLVRADNPTHGLERVRAAMRDAEIWDDAYAERLRVWPGDVRHPHLGLAQSDYDQLSGELDAIYHLAADVSLLSPYAVIRAANTTSFAGIIEMALRRRTKHLVYASTMGVFPQYFCDFSGEFSDHRVDDGDEPDLDLLESTAPADVIGYPWSKLVVERAMRFGQSLGIPIAIMRLPQTGRAARTGYIHTNDVKTRILMAVLDVGLLPAGLRSSAWTEPVDNVSQLLVSVSLNPDRRHTTYHLVNPSPVDHDLDLPDFGIELRECTYAEFRHACRTRGARSPLHRYWPLVDQFAQYWFSSGAASSAPPVTADAVAADTLSPPEWPGLVTITARSLAWIERRDQTWPFTRPRVSLDTDALLRHADRLATRFSVRFDEAYPPQLVVGLDQLLRALRSPAARISEDKVARLYFEFGRRLFNRAALTSEYLREPAIGAEPVQRPVFIIGINRTGTTLLHRLLAQGDRFWAPRLPELEHPALPVGRPEAARREYVDDLIAASGIADTLRGIHPVDADAPEEDLELLNQSFAAWSYPLRFHIPEYAEWLTGRNSGFAYGLHRRTLQHLGWQRGVRLAAPRRQWLLKMPFHLADLETLLATYPDAILIQTHRSPREFTPSWFSLAEAVRGSTTQSPDTVAIGREQLDRMGRMLEDATRFRAAHPEHEHRFLDISYYHLVEDPEGVVDQIYQKYGWTLDDETRARMRRWNAQQAANRTGEPTRRYSLDRYGVTADQVDAAFADYRRFVERTGIRMR